MDPRSPSKISTLILLCISLAAPAVAVAGKGPETNKERELIQVLQSGAPPEAKAVTCKKLAVYGTKDAVPALAALLSDEQLASWSRIALEAIPGSAPDKALRDAAPKLQGRLLIGVINSIGVRRDDKAVGLLAKKLDDEADIASAAAESLGRIGGSQAAKVLQAHLTTSPPAIRSAVAEGCVRCAETFMKEGSYAKAVKLYDAVRAAEVPQERMLEATRGAILARRSDGLPLLLEQLRSSDKALVAMGLHTARELPGPEITKALAAEFQKAAPERQPLLLLALDERNDPTAVPTILEAARKGPKEVRMVAITVLDRSGNTAALQVLLDVAAGSDAELTQAAKNALGRLPGTAVDQEIMRRIPGADSKMRPVLLEVAGRRAMESAVPTLIQYLNSPESKTRNAALGAIATIGGDHEAAALVSRLQSRQTDDRRAELEKALLAISSRRGSSCTPVLLPLMNSVDNPVRVVGLRALAAAGGPAALEAVLTATKDSDPVVREEAVQTLVSWPNTWPEDNKAADALLALAKSAEKQEHQILAQRGFLQFLLGDEKLKPEEKLRRVNEVLPLLRRPEDKRLAIAVIRQIPRSDAIDLLEKFAGDPALSEDACSALIEVANQPKSKLSKEVRQQALQVAVDKSATDSLKQKAQDALQKLN